MFTDPDDEQEVDLEPSLNTNNSPKFNLPLLSSLNCILFVIFFGIAIFIDETS